MRIIRHNDYIKGRKRRARWIALIGFALLTSTLWIALNPNFILPAYGLMLVGFIVFNMGMQQLGKWSRNPRNDQMIDTELRTVSDKYVIAHYPPVGPRRVEHVVVHPGGALILVAREIDGEIHARGDSWRRTGAGLRRLFSFSGPQLNNPSREAAEAAASLDEFLEQHDLSVDVEAAIVFVHPLVQLHVEEPAYPVLHLDEVPGFLQQLVPDPSLSAAERERLVELLGAGEGVERPITPQTRRPVKRRAA
jgi:hypothetical protein